MNAYQREQFLASLGYTKPAPPTVAEPVQGGGIACTRCKRIRKPLTRGCCKGCYTYISKHGLFADYPARETCARRPQVSPYEAGIVTARDEYQRLNYHTPYAHTTPRTTEQRDWCEGYQAEYARLMREHGQEAAA